MNEDKFYSARYMSLKERRDLELSIEDGLDIGPAWEWAIKFLDVLNGMDKLNG